MRRLPLLILGCMALMASAHGQISVDLNIKRRSFIRHEPIIATVNVTNLSGRDLTLQDGEAPWFSFQINTANKTLVAPRDAEYRLDPLPLKAGETVKRTVNLNTLYGISEYGIHRVKATIYTSELDKFYSSKVTNIDIGEGRTLWRQDVGVPEGLPNGGHTHSVSLLSWQENKRSLYCRVEDRESGTIFCTYQLGHLISGEEPAIQFDAQNNVYVLSLAGPKQYVLYKISVNGEFLGQTNYVTTKSRPALRRLADGTLQIVGGRRELAQTTVEMPQPKLSDRPAGLPVN